jgi:exodeoxyribonuclease VII large subunit
MTLDLFSQPASEGGDKGGGRSAAGARRAAPPRSEPGEALTVSAVATMARQLLERSFSAVAVAGEVSGWKRYPSGHCYFTLKDAAAQLRCVMFRAEAQRLPTGPAEGMEVRLVGTLTLYERRGDCQLVVRELEARGAGGLWRLAFERLVARLDAEGLLAAARKRPIPRVPRTIGLVTSPAGAALHDMLDCIRRRAPWTHVILCPAKVQGEGAAEDIARALGCIARSPEPVDVVIVGRGGGSVEDLWAFNEEVVARAIAASPIPVISAVGHEVDVTIADLVADLRAPTPTAAAELAVPDRRALARGLTDLRMRLGSGVRSVHQDLQRRLGHARTDLEAAARDAIRSRRERLGLAAGRLDALSPLATLRRGYAVALDDGGHVLRGVDEFATGMAVRLRVADGNVNCRVESSMRDERGVEGDG